MTMLPVNSNMEGVHFYHKSLLKDSAGFSLAEMLVTTLIMALASLLLATGVPMAIDTYRTTVNTSNAQVALSTTISALKGELSLAREVNVNGTSIYYYTSNGYWMRIDNSTSASNYGLEIIQMAGIYDSNKQNFGLKPVSRRYPLIANQAITDELRVKYGLVTTDACSIVINDLQVIDAATAQVLAKVDVFRIATRFVS